MKFKLIELHQRSNGMNTYLLGSILRENNDWLTFLSVDPAGNQGGIRYILKKDIIGIKDNTEAINFFKNLMVTGQAADPFTLTNTNRSLLANTFDDLYDILQFAFKNERLIKIGLRNSALYGGFITNLNRQEVRLFTYNDDKVFEELVETTIKLTDIVEIVFNDVDLKLSSEYFSYLGSQGEIGNDLGISQIYFQYTDDFRFDQDMMLGWIINENDDYLLVDRLDDAGQVVAVTLVNKDSVAHITNDSDYLNFINFAVEYNQRHGILDPYNFDNLAHQFTTLPSFETIVNTAKPDHLLLFDDYQLDGSNWGSVVQKNQNDFVILPISNFQFSEPLTIPYSDLCAIDLVSSDTLHLQSYLRARRRL